MNATPSIRKSKLGGTAFAFLREDDDEGKQSERPEPTNSAVIGLRSEIVRQEKQEEQEDASDLDGKALDGAELDWEEWLYAKFPHVASAAPAPHHRKFWDWIEALVPGVIPPSFIACWPRGGGKSTTCELGAVRVGIRLARRFLLIVCETQDQADERVQAISNLFLHYGVRNAINKLGHSKGWKRNQLHTENGFNVAGIGLDVAVRGIKFEEFRPDWIHLDDIDGREDTPRRIKKKQRTLTQSILKAGAKDLAISWGQNLISEDSIMSGVITGKADFLLDRIVSGPIAAVEGLETKRVPRPDGGMKYAVVGGKAVWDGQDLITCEASINQAGLDAFLRESQQEVAETTGGLWERSRDIHYWEDHAGRLGFDPDQLPDFHKVGIAVDPSGSARGDEVGIVAAGAFRLPGSGLLCAIVLEDGSGQMGAKQWAQRGVEMYDDWEADILLAESNFGGEMTEATFETTDQRDPKTEKLIRKSPPVTMVRVSRGKKIRAQPIQKKYEEVVVFHLHRFIDMENQLCGWKPDDKQPSPGRLDAVVIVLSELFGIADHIKKVESAETSRAIIAGVNLHGGGGSGKSTHTGPRSAGGWSKFGKRN